MYQLIKNKKNKFDILYNLITLLIYIMNFIYKFKFN